MKRKYPVIALIGSEEFESEFHKVAKELTLRGYIVLTSNAFVGDINIYPLEKNIELLKSMDKQRIDMCDEVLVINSNGYLSKTFSDKIKDEIKYAKTLSKKVNYLYYKCNKDTCIYKEELCKNVESPIYSKRILANVLDNNLEPFDTPVCEWYKSCYQQ